MSLTLLSLASAPLRRSVENLLLGRWPGAFPCSFFSSLGASASWSHPSACACSSLCLPWARPCPGWLSLCPRGASLPPLPGWPLSVEWSAHSAFLVPALPFAYALLSVPACLFGSLFRFLVSISLPSSSQQGHLSGSRSGISGRSSGLPITIFTELRAPHAHRDPRFLGIGRPRRESLSVNDAHASHLLKDGTAHAFGCALSVRFALTHQRETGLEMGRHVRLHGNGGRRREREIQKWEVRKTTQRQQRDNQRCNSCRCPDQTYRF